MSGRSRGTTILWYVWPPAYGDAWNPVGGEELAKGIWQTLKKAGFIQGKSNPCLSRHPDMSLSTFVHGDDFVSSGPGESLAWLQNMLETNTR